MDLYRLDEASIEPVPRQSFGALGILERSHLQPVLKSRLDVIVPDCLLLAEEFGDWTDSSRRIDLLAIDRYARLVVIELKRSEDAGHAELQALRYAAMVSMMTFEQAVQAHGRYLNANGVAEDARARLLAFLGWSEPRPDFADDVRIVLVAADFSREVTTTVLWLRDYEIDVSCVRLRPYVSDGKTFVTVETLIPLPETAEYQVSIRERKEARREAAAAGNRYQKYAITNGTVVERQLYKRQAVHRLVRALVERGVSPDDLAAAVRGYHQSLFVSAPGHLNAVEFTDAARAECERVGRTFDATRFSSRDGELLYFGDRTYAVTNQVGANTELVLDHLMSCCSTPDVKWSRSDG